MPNRKRIYGAERTRFVATMSACSPSPQASQSRAFIYLQMVDEI